MVGASLLPARISTVASVGRDKPEQRRAVIRPRQQAWRRYSGRRYPRIGGSGDLSDEIPALGISRQAPGKAVVKLER